MLGGTKAILTTIMEHMDDIGEGCRFDPVVELRSIIDGMCGSHLVARLDKIVGGLEGGIYVKSHFTKDLDEITKLKAENLRLKTELAESIAAKANLEQELRYLQDFNNSQGATIQNYLRSMNMTSEPTPMLDEISQHNARVKSHLDKEIERFMEKCRQAKLESDADFAQQYRDETRKLLDKMIDYLRDEIDKGVKKGCDCSVEDVILALFRRCLDKVASSDDAPSSKDALLENCGFENARLVAENARLRKAIQDALDTKGPYQSIFFQTTDILHTALEPKE